MIKNSHCSGKFHLNANIERNHMFVSCKQLIDEKDGIEKWMEQMELVFVESDVLH